MPTFTLGEIAAKTGGILTGDPAVIISDIAELESANSGDIAFVADVRHKSLLDTTGAGAVIVPKNMTADRIPMIAVDNPQKSFFEIAGYLRPQHPPFKNEIHPRAWIGDGCEIHESVSIGPFTVIGPGTRIGAGTIIYSNVFIGEKCEIGENCLFYPQVTVREKCIVGNRVILQPGAVIGSDGFGYGKEGERYVKLAQTGRVVLEDDVEIGANSTVDRAAIHETRIGKGTKLDNLVHVAHNCRVGRNGLMAALVGVAGSTTIGDNVILAGQVGIVDHVSIADNVILAAGAGASKSITEPGIYWGRPAKPIRLMRKIEVLMRKLPELFDRLKKLEHESKKD